MSVRSSGRVLRFLALAYGITWPLLGLLVLDNRDLVSLPGPTSAFVGAFATLGPGLAALILVAQERRTSATDFLRASLDRRYEAKWYVFAIAGPVFLLLIAAAAAVLVSHTHIPRPDLAWTIPLTTMILIVEAFGEELGWRGWLLPRLLARRTPVAASFIVGCAWAIWHVPLFLTTGNVISEVPFMAYAALILAGSFAFTWLYCRTSSVLLATLMHGFLNAAATPFLLDADPATIRSLFAWFALTVAAAAAALVAHGLGDRVDRVTR